MNPESVDVMSVFARALEKTDARERTAYLDDVCGTNTALRAEVESLLISYDQAKGFLPSPDLDQAVTLDSAAFIDGPGTIIGRYKLLEKIGEGGMAVVYMAEQEEPIRRKVALKIIKLGMDTRQVIARFEAERQALALLDHPSIAKVLDAGATETGRPYFVMELVHGVSITEYCDKNRLDTRGRVALFVQVCHAVQHAHQKGIIHRDLKPSNVMVTMHDDKPVPKVIDFGIAKATNQRLTEKTLFTRYAHMIGTPAYMSPEQAQISGLDVDTRTDIYSLGVLFYELLTGTTPFEPRMLQSAGYAEIERIIRETDPPKPSTRLRSLGQEGMDVARSRQTSGEALRKVIKGDLDCIVMKCLEKDRTRRYATAHALADELGCFLDHRPILARPVRLPEKAWRWCRRNPVIATLAAAAILIFLLGSAGVTWEAWQARKARDLAQGRLYAAQMKLAHAAYRDGKIGGALELLKAQKPPAGQPDFRGFDWRFLYRLCSSSLGEVIATNPSGFQSVGFSPDRRTVAFGAGDGAVEIFDLDSRQCVRRWQAHEGVIDGLAFSPGNPNRLATVSGDDGLLKLWDVTAKRMLFHVNGARGIFVNVAFSPDGTLLATGNPDTGSLNLWEVQSSPSGGTTTMILKANLGFRGPGVFSPNARIMALCRAFGVALYDLASGILTHLPPAHTDIVQCAAFSPDGNMLATGGADERVVLWDVKDPEKPVRLHCFETSFIAVTCVTFSPDSETLFVGCYDQNIRFWHVKKPTQMLSLPGHSAGINALALSADGSLLASAGLDGTARLWSVPKEGTVPGAQPPAEYSSLLNSEDTIRPAFKIRSVYGVAVSPDQRWVAAAAHERLVVCDLATGKELSTVTATDVFERSGTKFRSVAFSPDGRSLAVGGGLGELALLDGVTLQRLKKWDALHKTQITDIAFALGGSVLVTGGGFGSGIKWTDVASGQLIGDINALEGPLPVQPLAVSRDGKRLAARGPEGRVCVWDIASVHQVARSPQKVRLLVCAAFSPDGRVLAFADGLGAIFLWDYEQRGLVRKLVGHAGWANALAFSPEGTLASAGTDHTVKLWNPNIDQEVATLEGHTGWVWCVAFSQDGNTLVSGSRDGTLKIWRALSLDQIGTRANADADAQQ